MPNILKIDMFVRIWGTHTQNRLFEWRKINEQAFIGCGLGDVLFFVEGCIMYDGPDVIFYTYNFIHEISKNDEKCGLFYTYCHGKWA